MAEDIEWYLEAERRGLLKPDESAWLTEARRRGLAPGGEPTLPGPPTMNFDPMAMLTAPISGIANILPTAYNMIANPLQAYKDLTIGSEAQQPKTLAEADKFYNNRAVMPRVIGTAEGLASGAAMGIPQRFLPETTDPDRLASRELGSTIGGIATGGALYKELGKRAIAGRIASGMSEEAAKKVGATAIQYLGLPAFMGAAEPLSRLDIPGAIEGAFTGGGLGALAKGATDVAGSGLNYLGNVRPLRQQAAKAGGAAGVMKGIINPQTEAVLPNKLIGFPGETTEPISVQRGGEILGEFKKIASEATTQEASALHSDMMKAAPKAPISHPIAEVFSNLVSEIDPAVQSPAMKKIAAIGNNLANKNKGEGLSLGGTTFRASDFAGLGQTSQATIAAEMGNLSTGNVTFENLVKTYQNLNRINTGSDLAAGHLVSIAKDIVKQGIDKFDKTAPDAVRGWYKFRDFYANEFGKRFGENAPFGKLTKEDYGRFLKPDEMRMNDMGAMEPSEINNVYETMGKAPRGHEAVDAVRAAHLQRFKELISDQEGNPSAKQLVLQIAAEPKDSAVTRQWQALLGPRRFAGMKVLADTLRDAGYTGSNLEGRGVLGPMEAFHVLRGGVQAAGGNPLGASYHFITATIMKLSPSLFDKMVSNRVGARLLAEGLMEKPGTPGGDRIAARIAKMASSMGEPIDLEGAPAAPSGPGEPIDVTPRADMTKLALPGGNRALIAPASPVINQGPPPGPPQLPPPGPGNRPPTPIAPLIEPLRSPAVRSAEVFRNEPPTEKMLKAEKEALKRTPNTPENIEALKRSYRSQQALGERFPEMDRATEGILTKFQDTPPSAAERQQLQALLHKSVKPNVKDAAALVLRREYPASFQPELPPQPLAEAPAVPPPAAEVVHPADAIRARQKAEAALRPKGKATVNEAEISPVALMNRITRNGEKIRVTAGEMGEMRATFGDAKARQWFSENGTQALDDAISLFENNYGISGDYNSFKGHLEDAFSAQAKKNGARRRK